MWGSEKLHVTEHECDSPRVNVWYALMKNKFIGPFLFKEPMVTGDSFLAMMVNTALCHVPVGSFPVNLTSSYCLCLSEQEVFGCLDRKRGRPILWIAHSLDLIPLDFFSMGL